MTHYIWDVENNEVVAVENQRNRHGGFWTVEQLYEFAQDHNYKEGYDQYVVKDDYDALRREQSRAEDAMIRRERSRRLRVSEGGRPYYYQGDPYCEVHAPRGSEEGDPGEEVDHPRHCSECGALLATSLTVAGAEYVRRQIWRFIRRGEGRKRTLLAWARRWFPEMVGQVSARRA